MIERIEQAHDTADQLPTDLKSLSEARQEIENLAKEAARHQSDVLRISEHANELNKLLNKKQRLTSEASNDRA